MIQSKSENMKKIMLIYRNIIEIDAFLLDMNLLYYVVSEEFMFCGCDMIFSIELFS